MVFGCATFFIFAFGPNLQKSSLKKFTKSIEPELRYAREVELAIPRKWSNKKTLNLSFESALDRRCLDLLYHLIDNIEN
jgi:hypothetical protein